MRAAHTRMDRGGGAAACRACWGAGLPADTGTGRCAGEDAVMVDPRLNLPDWDALSSAEREAAARDIGGRLPAAFRFAGLERHSLGDQAHEVAVFTHGDSAFVLIPGGTG